MNLWLHFFPLPVVSHVLCVDFVIEVADIADNRSSFGRCEHKLVTHVYIAGRSDD